MRISVAQLNYHIGNFESNLNKMLAAVETARQEKSDLILFGELATTGYPPRDFLEFSEFLRKSDDCIRALQEASDGIGIIVGAPRKNPKPEGKDLFNSAFFLYNREVLHIADKALLPTYDVFDEYRYFEPAKEFKVVNFKGKRLGITICEDIWNVGNENPLYTTCPYDEMRDQQPEILINVSASPFTYNHAEERLAVIRANVARYNAPMIYVNHAGAQTELIFDGGSVVMNAKGVVADELPFFVEEIRTYDFQKDIVEATENKIQPKEKTDLIHRALLTGIRDYFHKLGLKKAILGLSGGIDSAVVVALAAEALGAENVRVLLLPSQFSSDHSIQDARTLAENLNVQYDIVNISDSYDAVMKTLAPQFAATPFNLAEENIQARLRGLLLMAMSNKFGAILLNTSNKSEAAVGYGTLYGDMCGGLSVIADLYKTEVYALAYHINRHKEIIPENTLVKAPSAELRPGQKDADSLPDYDTLDKLLYQYIEKRQGSEELIAMGFDAALVKRVLKMVNTNEFKRAQTPPTLRVSSKAFGMGRRMPIVGKYLS